MSIRTQLERRIAPTQSTARYLRTSGNSVRYLGWLGQRNLGDEAVHQALEGYLAPHELAWRPERMPDVLRSRATKKTHALTVLGGGTLIGGRYVSDFTEESEPSRRAIFGSGVIDPEFPHSYRNGLEPLDHWIEAIDGIAVLGVRGPYSQQILSERGVTAQILGDPVAAFVQPEGHWRPSSVGRGGDRVLGVNVGQSAGGMFGSELDMLKHTADAVRTYVKRGWTVEYFVVWPEDLHVTNIFARDVNTRDAKIHRVYDRAADFLALSRHLDAFIGLKLHAVALAACAGVPSASIAYQPKSIDFLASLGLERLAVRSDRMSRGELSLVVEELADDGDAISATSRTALLDLRGRQRKAAAVLAAILQSS
jgi:hypothetical protein